MTGNNSKLPAVEGNQRQFYPAHYIPSCPDFPLATKSIAEGKEGGNVGLFSFH
jgi:hypothetical protein